MHKRSEKEQKSKPHRCAAQHHPFFSHVVLLPFFLTPDILQTHPAQAMMHSPLAKALTIKPPMPIVGQVQSMIML